MSEHKPIFEYTPQIMATFPDTVGGIVIASGVRNFETSGVLAERYLAGQAQVKARIGDTPLSELETLSAWRGVFRGFGVDPTKYRSAPEALLRRLTKKGDIPFINALVDIGNLVSIRYALPVCVIDQAQAQGTIRVHFADGTEHYTELHNNDAIHPDVGEVVFTDDTKTVFARRWCWRQSAQSAAQLHTSDVVITVEAQHKNGHADIENAARDLADMVKQYCGGDVRYAVLDRDHLAV